MHKQAYELCMAIEEMPASEQQTKVSVMAADLLREVEATKTNLLKSLHALVLEKMHCALLYAGKDVLEMTAPTGEQIHKRVTARFLNNMHWLKNYNYISDFKITTEGDYFTTSIRIHVAYLEPHDKEWHQIEWPEWQGLMNEQCSNMDRGTIVLASIRHWGVWNTMKWVYRRLRCRCCIQWYPGDTSGN